MAINWFEGGRRLSTLFMGIVAVAGIGYVAFGGSTNRVIFETISPDSPWKFTTKTCSYPDYEHYMDEPFYADGKKQPLSLCYRSQADKILYARAKEVVRPVFNPYPVGSPPPVGRKSSVKEWTYWTASPYSTEAETYMRDRAKSFRPDPAEWQKASGEFWKVKWKRGWQRANEATPWVVGSIFGIWLLTSILGWIIRGFAGIPTGRDYRPATNEK
jgi:hypothetical protein